jgi:cation:H+ antiporter
MGDYAYLALGVVFAAAGGELFVRGAVGLASAARVSGAIIGATVAAFATSSPELSVAINSALEQRPQIALGDALGSNVVNVALILGLALLISPIQCSRGSVKRDFPVALAVPPVTGLLCLDGTLSRIEGVLLLALFLAWLAAVILDARSQRRASGQAGSSSVWSCSSRPAG